MVDTQLRSTEMSRQGAPGRRARPTLVLVVVLVATLAINIDTTIVNIALPTLARALLSSTGDLQWIVDGYNLAFAALVLAGGTLGDRFGRRGTLVTGLLLFAATSVAAGLSTDVGELIAFRFAMGAASALIFPTTLAIITATFPDPRRRAAAIGAWGGVAGLGVAVGPIAGGALLRAFDWGSIFLAMVPVAVVAAILAAVAVPRAARSRTARLDGVGLVLSIVLLGALVRTIIQAPDDGWTSPSTFGGFALAAVSLVGFVLWERRRADPLLDVRLFTNLRFSAASGAVTVAFFALFGFIFLITQFFQELQGLDPLTTGVRILPVAVSIAIGSVLGARVAASRIGTKGVVALGLMMMGASFAWISTVDPSTPYPVVAAQMVLLGGGLGLTTAPATDAVMGVVRPEQAGAGSAVNDATRTVGGTLGVAVVGSIYSSIYGGHLDGSRVLSELPARVASTAREGLAQGLAVAGRAPAPIGRLLHEVVQNGFLDGLHAGCLTAAAVCGAGAIAAAILLPRYASRG